MNRREFKLSKRQFLQLTGKTGGLILAGCGLVSFAYKIIARSDMLGTEASKEEPANKLSQLNYFFEYPIGGESLCIRNGDSRQISLVLEQIIGTLVRTNVSGRIEPYLAESFTQSVDNKKWRFRMRENLKAEDLSPVDAQSYTRSLTRTLRELSNWQKSVMEFSHLKGWNSFTSDKSATSIVGLYAEDNDVIFEFDVAPSSFLEILAMNYFGDWRERNDNCEQITHLISTGPYRLKKQEKEFFELELRTGWFSSKESSFRQVRFYGANNQIKPNDLNPTSNSIIIEATSEKLDGPFRKLVSTKEFTTTLVLSPFKKGPLQNIENRKYIRDVIRNIHIKKRNDNNLFLHSEAKSEVVFNDSMRVNVEPEIQLKGAVITPQNDLIKYIQSKDSIFQILDIPGFKIQFEGYLGDQAKFVAETFTNKRYDLRFIGVDAGAYPLLAIIKMMFCTTMGVSFPDPSGNICRLVAEYQDKNQSVDDDFVRRLNQTIYDDACVIPLDKQTAKWFLTADIDQGTFSPTDFTRPFESIVKHGSDK